jgi:hypothetical protein
MNVMKYLTSLLLTISFVAVGVFGFAIFDHVMMDGPNSDCVTSAINGIKCPASIMGMVLHHVSVVQVFTTMVVPPIGSLLLLIAFLLFLGATFFSPYFFKPPRLAFNVYRFRDFFSPPQNQQLTRWLALHENSPAIF